MLQKKIVMWVDRGGVSSTSESAHIVFPGMKYAGNGGFWRLFGPYFQGFIGERDYVAVVDDFGCLFEVAERGHR